MTGPGRPKLGWTVTRIRAGRTEPKGVDMAWDFETEPEFESKLEWIRQFVVDRIEPLDLIYPGARSTRSTTRLPRS